VIAPRSAAHQLSVNTSLWGFGLGSVGLSVLLSSSLAWAGEDLRLVYSAANGCPDRAAFESAVAERGGHFVADGAASTQRELHVSIQTDASAFRGTLRAEQPEGASTTREVHAATCQEVADALAVVSAIALRGDAPLETAAPPPSATPSAPASVTPEKPPDEGRLRASGTVRNEKVTVSAGTLRFDKATSFRLFAGGEVGLLPSQIVPRYDLTFGAASFVTTPDGKSFLDSIIPRIRFSYLGRATYQTADASTRLEGVSLGIGLCWSPFYDTGGFVALLCGEYGGGLINTKVHDTAGKQTQDKTTGFGSASVGLEGAYNFGSFLHIGLKLGFDAPLQGFSAERADGSRIFSSSPILGYGMLGLGVHF
jgi:hypothetical protein